MARQVIILEQLSQSNFLSRHQSDQLFPKNHLKVTVPKQVYQSNYLKAI